MSALTPPAIARAQDRLLTLLGSSPAGRTALLVGMLRHDASEATSYWFQLGVSAGIGILGLVLGSTAVVIGAMLIAPLMGPIVGLGMGLATGSPFLVLRSAGRIGLSVIAAVAGSALITLLLPFHQINAEISSRASPTVLDLITAGFCALAGVYASLRPGSDTATTAAGTAISISLVPPLCASGYGFGARDWSVAGGAALSFLTNLVAIVVVGTVAFVAAGFNGLDVTRLEREELGREARTTQLAGRLARRLARLFESRWGPVLRFMMPLVLLAAVYVPLRQAFDEVAWQVRVRAAVQESIAREPLHVVDSRVRIDRHEVDVVVVVLGTVEDADRTRARLDADIGRASGIPPHVEVLAVPDASAFAGLESTLLTPHGVKPAAGTTSTPDESLSAARDRVREAVADLWPATAAGKPLAVDLGTGQRGPVRVRVVHLGPPLGADGAEALRRALAPSLGQDVRLVDVAVPTETLTREHGDLDLVASVSAGVRATAGVPAVSVCVIRPTEAPRARRTPADEELARALDAVLAAHPRVTTASGPAWSVRFVEGECPSPTAPDGGVSDGGSD